MPLLFLSGLPLRITRKGFSPSAKRILKQQFTGEKKTLKERRRQGQEHEARAGDQWQVAYSILLRTLFGLRVEFIVLKSWNSSLLLEKTSQDPFSHSGT